MAALLKLNRMQGFITEDKDTGLIIFFDYTFRFTVIS
jgi:hypothetical protein